MKNTATEWFDGREIEIDAITATLRHHHHSEDEDVWPLLLQRVGLAATAGINSSAMAFG